MKPIKPAFLIAAAVVALLGVAAIAFAATGGDSNGESAQSPSPTATASASATPTTEPSPTATSTATEEPPATPTSEPPTATPEPPIENPPLPTAPATDPDAPVTFEPEPTAGSSTPIPSEPLFTVTPADPDPVLPADRYAEFAPIESVGVTIAESFPPQYFVNIKAGLPSGCAEQYTHSFTRTGNHIEITVLNSFPTGAVACTAIYGIYDVNVALGTDFVSGQTYTVSVNEGAAETEFVAQ